MELILSEEQKLLQDSAARFMQQSAGTGLVRRVRNRKDRRTINIFPTQKGRNLKNELLRAAIQINEIATEGFSPQDMENIKRLMTSMKANLDRDEESSPT